MSVVVPNEQKVTQNEQPVEPFLPTMNTSSQVNTMKRVTVAGAIANGLAFIVQKATDNPQVMAAIMGGIGAIPGLGQGIIAAVALCAVAFYAIKLLKEQFSKYLLIVRTLDEFTILLHKIQKLTHLAVLISSSYKFDINIDEVNEQLKIIFSHFDEVLKLEKGGENNYHKIETAVMSLTTSPDYGSAAADATTAASENAAAAKQQVAAEVKPNGQGGGAVQSGGGPLWWDRFAFNDKEWNTELNNNVVKLNIYLTTAMGEFSIILNIIQMNMIVNGLGTHDTLKVEAITSLTKKNTFIQDSDEYRQMRTGILVHDILKLRVDFHYCKQKAGTGIFAVKTEGRPVCQAYIDKRENGKTFTKYRKNLHEIMKILKMRLKDGDYDEKTKTSVSENVLKPYFDMLKKAKWGDAELAPAATPTAREKELLTLFGLSSLTLDDKTSQNAALDVKIIEIQGVSGQPGQVGGKFLDIFKRNKNEPTEDPIITVKNFLKDEPYNLVTDNELANFLRKVYDYSSKMKKTSPETIKKSLELLAETTGNDVPADAEARLLTETPANVVSNAILDNSPAPAPAPAAPAPAADADAAPPAAAAPAPALPEKNGFFSGLFGSKKAGGATRKKARRTKSTQNPKRKSYKYRVKL
jgi:hypothetical protein